MFHIIWSNCKCSILALFSTCSLLVYRNTFLKIILYPTDLSDSLKGLGFPHTDSHVTCKEAHLFPSDLYTSDVHFFIAAIQTSSSELKRDENRLPCLDPSIIRNTLSLSKLAIMLAIGFCNSLSKIKVFYYFASFLKAFVVNEYWIFCHTFLRNWYTHVTSYLDH